MLYAIVCTQGHMNSREVENECVAQKWVPLVVFRKEGKTFMPFFKVTKFARRFAKRNLPKEWLTGAVNLGDEDRAIITGKGIICTVLDFPDKLKDVAEFDIEIHEYHPNTEVEMAIMKPP
ncbi:MAG: hypothetical protein Q7S57_02050 [bacterium]|nr:hypothetical protein [bacterium]